MRARLLFKDALLTAAFLAAAFIASLLIERCFHTYSLFPAVFTLAVFLISLTTQGYVWGISASLVAVLAVNFAFTFPYFHFNFSIPENLISAVIMLAVTLLTSMLTTKVKRQEKQRAEGEMEKTRANLLRAVSHDLRTPLTSIYGACSAVTENYDRLSRAQQIKLLTEARADAEWLIRMVENLLSVTRIDGGSIVVRKTPTVLEELVDTLLVRFASRHPGQRVVTEIPDEFVSIPMDATLIEQVLINLLENAVEHAEGMTLIKLRVTVDRDSAVFEVEDDGCGIPPQQMERLFTGGITERSNSSDDKKHSMGIGLSVCATILRAHGGAISAQNGRGGGTVIRFTLPMEEKSNAEQV